MGISWQHFFAKGGLLFVFDPSGYVVMFPLASDFEVDVTPAGIVDKVLDFPDITSVDLGMTGSAGVAACEALWSTVLERPCDRDGDSPTV